MRFLSSRLLLVVFILFLIEFYSFMAVRTATKKIKGRKKTLIFTLYILLTTLCWILIFSFRSMGYAHWSDTAKTLLIAGMMGILLAKVLMALLMLIDDLRRSLQWLIRKVWTTAREVGKKNRKEVQKLPLPKISRSTFISKSAILAGGVAFGGVLLGTKNKYNYKIRKQVIRIKNLPSGLQGLKVVQISDIHCGSFDDREEVARGVQMVLDQQPDMIVFTGDLVNNRADELLPYQDIFARLKAPLGVYSVLGNHDYGHYVKWDNDADRIADVELLKKYQEQMGWKLLLNEHIPVEHNGGKLHLIGVENWSAKPQFPQYGDLSKACSGIDWTTSDVNILLTHDPSHWHAEVVPRFKQIDLSLSGHTHGMQFGVRIPGFQWSPVQYVYKEWLGLYQQARQNLYVNAGYGFLGYRGRLGIMPEITVLELTA